MENDYELSVYEHGEYHRNVHFTSKCIDVSSFALLNMMICLLSADSKHCVVLPVLGR